jgi:hypothetical protein
MFIKSTFTITVYYGQGKKGLKRRALYSQSGRFRGLWVSDLLSSQGLEA